MDAPGDSADVPAPESMQVEINLVDILDYLSDSVRPLREGCIVFESRHVICIGYRKRDEQSISITGYVTKSSHPNDVPHEVTLKITAEMVDWRLSCSCKAGTNRCKHIIGCLIHLNRSSTVEFMSCTDARQAWGLSRAEKTCPWGAKRISELCCVKKPPPLQASDDNLKMQVITDSFNDILKVAKTSAFSKHQAGRYLNPLPPPQSRVFQSVSSPRYEYCSVQDILNMITCTDCDVSACLMTPGCTEESDYYIRNVEISSEKIAQVAIDTQEQQGCNSWKIHRAMRITASSCYQLYTYLRNSNPDWNKKIAQYWKISNFKSAAMRYGSSTESKAFECYKRKRNPLTMKCGLVVKNNECWLAASPDGVDPMNKIILEIKCPASGEHGTLSDMVNSDSVKRFLHCCPETKRLTLNKNHSYYCQVQVNMYCLQCRLCDFLIYSSKDDDFLVIEVDFDPTYVEKVINSLKRLYFSKMLSKLLPTSQNAEGTL